MATDTCSGRAFSRRRTVALAGTTLLNLVALLYLEMPRGPSTDMAPTRHTAQPPGLQLSFFTASSVSSPPAHPRARRYGRPYGHTGTVMAATRYRSPFSGQPPGRSPMPVPLQSIGPHPAPLARRSSVSAVWPAPPVTASPPLPHFGNDALRQRLEAAADAGSIRGLPGTDTHRVAGIVLQDPAHQGLLQAAHQAQRLFGITRRACIDVQVEASLSPQQLIARHLTAAEVHADAQRNDCNRPPGLSI